MSDRRGSQETIPDPKEPGLTLLFHFRTLSFLSDQDIPYTRRPERE